MATDLCRDVLDKARAGIYSQFEVQRGLPIGLLIKYFTRDGETWRIAPDIRAMVQFRPLNLLSDFSHLGMFDVVFCRNVLIYFDQATKTDVLDRIGRVIEPRRLSGARRRRDRGGTDRQLPAGARPARALCAEHVRAEAGADAAGHRRRAIGRPDVARGSISPRPERGPPDWRCGRRAA